MMARRPMLQCVRRPDGVAVLTLDNPPLNLNTLDTIQELLGVCAELAADEAVRVVVVTGAGERAFCVGSDLNEFAAVRHQVVEAKLAEENRAFSAIAALPQPVVAALNGATLGGGAEIALACDLRVIDETAVIGFPEVKLGVFPGSGGVFRLPLLVGSSRALRLLYTGDPVPAAEAFRIGLVDEVAPHGQALQAALELATTLAARPSLALSLIKQGVAHAVRENTEQATTRTLADSARVFTGPDIEEGVKAFFAKRPPVFTAGRGHHTPKDPS